MNENRASDLLLDLIVGKWLSQSICVAAELGIADLVKDAPRSSGVIAEAIDASEDGVYRLLRALATMGLFVESEGRHFALSDRGAPLRSDHPSSVRAFARFVGHEINGQPWENLLHSIKTGRPSFDHVFGASVFDYIGTRPDIAAIANHAMTSLGTPEAAAIARVYDFQGLNTVADIGGGHGRLLAEVLKANPNMRGILFELPHALDGAQKLLKGAGVEDRCSIVGGDFFQAVPVSADAYFLKRVLHDWDDERSLQILRNCRKAMKLGAKMVVADIVIGSATQSQLSRMLDLEMLVITQGGRERTRDEFGKLYEASGFTLTRVVETGTLVSIVEGIAN